MNTQPKSLARRSFSATLKIAGAGATIAAIAALFVVTGPRGEVKESQADIADIGLNLKPRNNTERFVDALERLGHEPARTYAYNGEPVYFSTASTRKRPREAMLDYQQELVNQGINEKIYPAGPKPGPLTPENRDARWKERMNVYAGMLSGQMIPAYVDQERFILQGALIDGKPGSAAEVERYFAKLKTMQKNAKKIGPADVIKAHRYIEGNWDPEQQKTIVTASWSDEDNFNIGRAVGKAAGGSDAGKRAHTQVPTCMGCALVSNFTSANLNEPYSKQIFSTKQSPRDVMDFYTRMMAQRGWKESDTSRYARKVLREHTIYKNDPEIVREFVNGKKYLVIAANYEGEETMISTFLSQ